VSAANSSLSDATISVACARHGIGNAGDIGRMQPRQATVVRRDQTAGYLAGKQLDRAQGIP